MTIINRIGEVARIQGFNVKTLAERSGLTYNTAYDLYHARANRVGLGTLEKICTALNAQPGELLVWVPEKEEQHG
jgi:putative transcriptional regulator